MQLEAIRKKVTMVFQNGALFDSLTVGENVAFPLRERKDLTEDQIYQIVDGLLEMVGVGHMRELLPSDLSTGMKRSVAIARALSAQPECVLYDEPTTMVDPLMAQLLGDLIKRLKIQLASDQRGGDSRHAARQETGGSRGVLVRSEGDFLWDLCGDGEVPGADRAGISGVG